MELLFPETGMLCLTDFKLNVAFLTSSGSSPLVTPNTAAPGFTISAPDIDATVVPSSFLMIAAMEIVGEFWSSAGLVTIKETSRTSDDVILETACSTIVPVV